MGRDYIAYIYIYLIYMISLTLGQDEKEELGPLHMKPVMGLEIVLNVRYCRHSLVSLSIAGVR